MQGSSLARCDKGDQMTNTKVAFARDVIEVAAKRLLADHGVSRSRLPKELVTVIPNRGKSASEIRLAFKKASAKLRNA